LKSDWKTAVLSLQNLTKVYPYYAAALDGLGVASLPEKEFASHIETSELVRVLSRWCPPFRGYHLHYPSWRQPSPAFRLVVDALHVFVRFGSILLKNSVPEQGRHVTRQPEADLFDPQ